MHGLLEAATALENSGGDREEVTKSCAALVACLQQILRGERVGAEECEKLFRVIARCRREAIEQTLLSVKEYVKCDSLSVLDAEAWDPLCMLLFICECQSRACLLDNSSVALSFENEEARRMKREMNDGVKVLRPSEYLADERMRVYGISLTVCFDGVCVYETDGSYGKDSCVTRKGVRALERHCLIESLEDAIDEATSAYPIVDSSRDSERESAIEEWMKRNILVDANNTLLLRLDEFAVCCALSARDVVSASGERGGVPQEHRNTPAAWVARESLDDQAYRKLMTESKKNEAHPENAYVCFSALLEQHFNFEWLDRCFVSRTNPQRALKKIRAYAACATPKTAPLVVQGKNGTARVIRAGERIDAETPARAIDAWLAFAGEFTRKANADAVWSRIRKTSTETTEKRAADVPKNRIALIED